LQVGKNVIKGLGEVTVDKHEIAHVLENISTLMLLKNENPFKVRAYENAARAIAMLEGDIATYIEGSKGDW
jgi:DNA polymerase (family 10)